MNVKYKIWSIFSHSRSCCRFSSWSLFMCHILILYNFTYQQMRIVDSSYSYTAIKAFLLVYSFDLHIRFEKRIFNQIIKYVKWRTNNTQHTCIFAYSIQHVTRIHSWVTKTTTKFMKNIEKENIAKNNALILRSINLRISLNLKVWSIKICHASKQSTKDVWLCEFNTSNKKFKLKLDIGVIGFITHCWW